MNLYDFENRTIDELRQGYYLDETAKPTYTCLHCGATRATADAMERHQDKEHRPNRDALFFSLLNADSILKLSHAQKMTYYRIYKGKSDAAIADELHMNANTVRSLKYSLRKKYLESKAMLMLCEMMDLEKQPGGGKQAEQDDLIPGLDKQGRATGFFCTKQQAHDPRRPIPHSSVLILAAQRQNNGIMKFLTCVKSSKVLTLAGAADPDSDRLKKRWVDIIGGQCRKVDCPTLAKNQPLPDSIFTRASARVLKDELYLTASEPDPSKLVYLYTDETGKKGTPLYPTGQNVETSAVYLLRLPDGIPRNDIMVWDKWTDSLGASRSKRFPAEFVTWEELEGFAASDSIALMDGVQRVVSRMQRDPDLKQRMLTLLENADH